MLSLHIEAPNYEALLADIETALGLKFNPIASTPATTADKPASAKASAEKPALVASEPTPVAQATASTGGSPSSEQAAVTTSGTPAQLATQPAEPKSRRGRRSNADKAAAAATQQAAAAQPSAQAAPQGAVSAAASQAQVENSASGTASTPAPAPAPQAAAAAPTVTAPATPAPAAAASGAVPAKTEADVRAAMQKVNEKHGMPKCVEVLGKFYVRDEKDFLVSPNRKVERIKELHPSQFADVIAECEKAAAS